MADVIHKGMEQLVSFRRMNDFRVELHGIEIPGGILHACHRAHRCLCRDMEAFRDCCDIVGMRHPCRRLLFPVLQKGRAVDQLHIRMAVLADRCRLHFTLQQVCH